VSARSYLYVPGDSGRRLELAHTRGADAVIADLEDAVAPMRKSNAREQVSTWLADDTVGAPERWVRINSGDQGVDDLEQVFGVGLQGVCMPKVRGPEDVDRVAEALEGLERNIQWTKPPVVIMPLIESAAGLVSVTPIARAARVMRLQLGELDLAADLGVETAADELEMLNARATVVAASRAADLDAPVGAVRADVLDVSGFEESSRRLRRLGFRARAAIHPAQVPVIHAVFTPSPEEVDAARRLITRYEEALAAGVGVLRDDDGQMIDEAVVRHSRWIVTVMEEREGQR
jgi:citrate lyase subunit beta/citryl-CoA lyase